jgi:hypothetical protein
VRFFVFTLVAALLAAAPFMALPPAEVRADTGADIMPSQDELTTALAPLTVSNYKTGPGNDGWDATTDFDINGATDGQMHSSVDASVLPSKEGAAGFLQTKLQQLRDGTKQSGFLGDVAPAGDDLTLDADEAYWGVFLSPPDAPQQGVIAIHISRYDDQVIATTVALKPNGPVTDTTAQTLGAVTGAMLKLMNSD